MTKNPIKNHLQFFPTVKSVVRNGTKIFSPFKQERTFHLACVGQPLQRH